jgi:hypothetical protein
MAPQVAWDIGHPLTAVAAHSFNGAGYDQMVPGVIDRSGNFRIEGAPSGTYFLGFVNAYGVRHFFETSASSIDLGWDELGRPDLVTATNVTRMTFQLNGLQEPIGSNDDFEINSSNASVFASLRSGGCQFDATSASCQVEWSSASLNIIDGSRGDVALVYQLSSRVDSTSSLAYAAASRWAQLPSQVAVVDGLAQTVPVTLASTTASGTLSAMWRLSQFESYVSDWPGDRVPVQHDFYVGAIPWAVDGGPSANGSAVLVHATAGPRTSDATVGFTYGRFLPAFWKEYVEVQMSGGLRFPRGDSYLSYPLSVGALFPLEQVPSNLTPVVSPPRGLRISGRDASVPLMEVGAAPVLSWSAPALGTATFYDVDVEQVVSTGGSLSFETAATFRVFSTMLQMPRGLFRPGGTYVAFVTASAEMNPSFSSAPYRVHAPTAWADTATAPFTLAAGP